MEYWADSFSRVEDQSKIPGETDFQNSPWHHLGTTTNHSGSPSSPTLNPPGSYKMCWREDQAVTNNLQVDKSLDVCKKRKKEKKPHCFFAVKEDALFGKSI